MRAALLTAFLLGALSLAYAQQATAPLVFLGAGMDPVAMGFVESLRRPGGNITGTMWGHSGGPAFLKQWEYLQLVVPALKRGGILIWSEDLTEVERDPKLTAAARSSLKMEAEIREVRNRLGIEVIHVPIPTDASRKVISDIVTKARVQALVLQVGGEPVILDFLRNTKVPAMGWSFNMVRNGVLMGISSSHLDREAYAVEAVARILRGESPATIPVYVASKFSLAINLATARANAIAIPGVSGEKRKRCGGRQK